MLVAVQPAEGLVWLKCWNRLGSGQVAVSCLGCGSCVEGEAKGG